MQTLSSKTRFDDALRHGDFHAVRARTTQAKKKEFP
jgi:hypothetical protein